MTVVLYFLATILINDVNTKRSTRNDVNTKWIYRKPAEPPLVLKIQLKRIFNYDRFEISEEEVQAARLIGRSFRSRKMDGASSVYSSGAGHLVHILRRS